MNHYVEKLPGAFLEEKEFSLVFHFRKSDPAFAELRVKELMNHLVSFTTNMDVQIINGNRTLEIRNAGIDKGVAAMHWILKMKKRPRFILSAGDDWTDEDLFRAMPKDAYSIKVGHHASYSMFNMTTTQDLVNFLHELL